MGPSLKRRVYELVDFVPPVGGDRPRFDYFDIGLIALILANVVTAIIETVPGVRARYGRAMFAFEAFSIAVFTIEYLLRLWSCTENPRFAHSRVPRLRFALTPMWLIDLLAIAPFYLSLFVSADLRFILALRLMR